MKRLGVYLVGFRLALSNEFIYRTNFLFGRIRNFMVFAALLFLFQAFPHGAGSYDRSELLTYTLVSAFLSAILFVYGMHRIAFEIADGDLTNYLLRPVHYLGFWVSRLLANRVLLFVAGSIEVAILFVLFFRHETFVLAPSSQAVIQCVVLGFGALGLIQLLDFLAGIFSFWTHRSFGTRWLVTVLIQFFSGQLLALDLLPHWAERGLAFTPFPSLVYIPVKAYLGDLSTSAFIHALLVQWFWIVGLAIVLWVVWRRGVKRYEAYGR